MTVNSFQILQLQIGNAEFGYLSAFQSEIAENELIIGKDIDQIVQKANIEQGSVTNSVRFARDNFLSTDSKRRSCLWRDCAAMKI